MTSSTVVDALLARMTLEEKIGQMLAFGFSGSYPHPDILRMIERYHVAGFRVTPAGRKFVRYLKPGSPGEARVVRPPEPDEREYGASLPAPALPPAGYAAVLNTLRQRSLETGAGIPLYFALDLEGNLSLDYYAPGMAGFPHPMGLAQSGDPDLCRRVARSIGRQMAAVGINWIHSPTLDVNTDPHNPEINTRSYGPDPGIVAEYATQTLRGFDEAGILATGKHFPGRGHSALDAHFDVPVIGESRARLDAIHLAPYRALIRAGLPAIMLAHSIFPALDPSRNLATLSRSIITGLLREELGFDGVVMTDSFTMGGLANQFEIPDAAIAAIAAGVDLILLKDENALRGEVYAALLAAVRERRLSEDRVERAVRRVLAAKERIGLLAGSQGLVDLDRVEARLFDPEHAAVAAEAAAAATVVLRQQEGLLPLPPGARVLVVEEASVLHRRLNDRIAYPGALYHALLAAGVDATYTDFGAASVEKAWPIIQERAAQADLIVHTGFYERAGSSAAAHHARFLTLGKPTIFVTNNPYELIVSPQMSTVIVTFSPFAVAFDAVARLLCGAQRVKPLNFDPAQVY